MTGTDRAFRIASDHRDALLLLRASAAQCGKAIEVACLDRAIVEITHVMRHVHDPEFYTAEILA